MNHPANVPPPIASDNSWPFTEAERIPIDSRRDELEAIAWAEWLVGFLIGAIAALLLLWAMHP